MKDIDKFDNIRCWAKKTENSICSVIFFSKKSIEIIKLNFQMTVEMKF